ncbi:MAG: hypothetical protein NT027_05105 [Proteobacteria bacterium]|nr:hypothetical protein [Pseudomonadota bacterium]
MSLLVHFALYFFLLRVPSSTLHLQDAQRQLVVRLKHIDSDKTVDQKALSQKEELDHQRNRQRQSNQKNPKKASEGHADLNSKHQDGPRKQLFPNLDYFANKTVNKDDQSSHVEPSHGNERIDAARTYGIQGDRVSPSQDRNVDEVVSLLRIPNLWRTANGDATATLYLLKDGDELWIKSLHGDPMLRAILYQNLSRSQVYQYFLEHMSQYSKNELKIVFRFMRENDSYRGLNTEAIAFVDGILVTKKLPPVMRIFNGIAIEDEHSKKAKMREQQEIKALMESPAYSRFIDMERVLPPKKA